MPYSSLAHLISKRKVALGQSNIALEKGKLIVLTYINSANNYYKHNLVIVLI